MSCGAISFDPGWLALRELLDHRSRAAALMPLLQLAWRTHGWSRVLDLGSGTGSNLRYLGPRLPGMQEWTLLDRDPDLLARVEAPAVAASVTRVQGELGDRGLMAIQEAHLVTGSALLDLVSENWLGRAVQACSRHGCGAHFALTYDGEISWSLPDGGGTAEDELDDALIRDAVNLHQRGDKGLGPALGPTAGAVAETFFRREGYHTWLIASPWRVGPGDGPVARALVDGWARAALEVDDQTDRAQRVGSWSRRRSDAIARANFCLTVGHVDLLALPTDS